MNNIEANLMVSNTCNLNCEHCYLYEDKSFTKDIIKIDYDKLYNLKDNKNIKEIIIGAYGDPLQSKDYTIDELIYIVSYTNLFNPNIKVKIQSNLVLELNKKHFSLFSLLETIKTSFDTHTRFKSVKNLILWYNNIKRISKIHPVTLEITLNKYAISKGYERWNKFFDKLISKGYIDYYTFHHLQPIGNFDNYPDLKYTKEDFVNFMRGILEHNIPQNSNIKLFKEKCYFRNSDIALKDVYILDKECKIQKLNLCNISTIRQEIFTNFTDCILCDNYKDCGGRNLYDECYYDESLYNIAKEL